MKHKKETRLQELKKERKYYSTSSPNMDTERADFHGKPYPIEQKDTRHARDFIHNQDADVVMQGRRNAVPNKQWEQVLTICPAGIPNDPAGAFLPMSGTVRPVPHKKINECDY